VDSTDDGCQRRQASGPEPRTRASDATAAEVLRIPGISEYTYELDPSELRRGIDIVANAGSLENRASNVAANDQGVAAWFRKVYTKFIARLMESNNPLPEQAIGEPQESERVAGAVAEILRGYPEVLEGGPRGLSRFFEDVLVPTPGTDLGVGIALYTAMAASESDDLRGHVAVCVDCLYVADREAGLGVWRTLMEDPDLFVARSAWETLKSLEEKGQVLPGDAAALFEAYASAEDRRLPVPRLSDEEEAAEHRAYAAWVANEDERDQLAPRQKGNLRNSDQRL